MHRFSSGSLIRSCLIVTVLAGAVGLQSAGRASFTKHDKAYYADATVINFVRPGLVFKISTASIASDGTITARVLVTDSQGLPLDRSGVDTPGTISMSFIGATIPNGKKQYTSYTTRTVTAASAGATGIQAAADSGGTFAANADGDYTYTFKTKAPSGFDQTATHTVAVYGSRNLTAFNLGTNYASATLNFVPNGSKVTVTRDVVRDATCDNCHNSMEFHGGSRVGVAVCVLCHTPQSVDPNTGNTVDFPKMIHEIHMGSASPNAQAGNPYTIYGFNGPTNWADVEFPGTGSTSVTDPRNCAACHDPNSGAAQANAYLKPNREACGGCHDNVNFATGQNHVNLPQLDDSQCANCHIPQGELPFDASIMGAHVTPTQWSGLPGLVINIVKVSNGTAGSAPAITFTLKDGGGNPIAASSLVGGSKRLAAVLAGPTSDYGSTGFGTASTPGYVSENATKATCGSDGTCVYQFQTVIPASATGTFSIGMEGRAGYTINAGTTAAVTTEYGAVNKVINFSVDGSPVVPRRTVVSIAKCNACHTTLSVHGENRNQIEMCVLCHNPIDTDASTRASATNAADKAAPPQAINFALMIHNIHAGSAVAADGRPYVVVGFGGSHNDFSNVTFPAFSPAGGVGNIQNCQMCHVNGSEANLPTGLTNVVTPQGYQNPTPPVTAACMTCHAAKVQYSHAVANTTSFGESCADCHASGAAFGVDQVHAQ